LANEFGFVDLPEACQIRHMGYKTIMAYSWEDLPPPIITIRQDLSWEEETANISGTRTSKPME